MSDLTQRITELRPAERGRLLAALRARAPKADLRPHGTGVDAPLAPAQRTLWFVDQLTDGTNAYNLAHYYRISGPLDVAALERALSSVVRRQQVLRTCLREAGEGPIQIVVPEVPVELPTIEISGGLDEALDRARRELSVARIPLDRAPLWRAGLYRYAEQEHLLVFVIHHVIFDGASEEIFCRELSEFYRAETTGAPARLPELSVHYTDYARWQCERLDKGETDRLAAFWRERLQDAEPLDLPLDRPRPPEFGYRGQSCAGPLPAEVPAAARELARQMNSTVFLVYLTAFLAMLHQYTGQAQVTVGTSVSGRSRPPLEALLGFFVNVVALRGHAAPGATFREMLRDTEREQREAMAHVDLPFDAIVQAAAPERSLSRSQLFQVTFVTTPHIAAPRLAGAETEQIFLNHGIARFDMSWVVVDTDRPGTAVQYSTDILDRERVDAMIVHYGRLARWLLANPDEPLSSAPRP